MSASALLRLFSRLRRPRIWVPLLLVAALALAGPYLWAVYAWHAAQRALSRHRPREAAPYLQRCLSFWPRSPQVHLLAARAARLTEEYDEAERHLIECQRLEGKESDASVLEWGMLRAENGDLDGVEEFLRTQAVRHPSQAGPALEALAAGYLRMYRFFDAMRSLEQCLERDPENLRALYLRGRAWERVHAYPKAAADYEQVVARDPENDDARLRLANCRLENGEAKESVSHLEHLRRRRPDNPDVLVRLAFAWNAVGKSRESLELIDEVLAQHPSLPAALSARGQLAFQAERPAEAERWLRKAIAARPFDRAAHYVLQQCLERQGKTAEAEVQRQELRRIEDNINRLIAIANRLMPKTPQDPALHHELGTILLRMGEEELGHRWFHSALKQDPRYQPAHLALAEYYEQKRNPQRAAFHRQQAQNAPGQSSHPKPVPKKDGK